MIDLAEIVDVTRVVRDELDELDPEGSDSTEWGRGVMGDWWLREGIDPDAMDQIALRAVIYPLAVASGNGPLAGALMSLFYVGFNIGWTLHRDTT